MSHSDSGHLGNLKSFDELLSAVRGFSAGYNPSKDEFRINALEAKSAEGHNQITNMNVRMSAYKSAVEHRAMIYLPFQNLRNKEFYDPETGLVEIGKGDKLFIKAIYCASTPQNHQVSGINFKP